MKFKVGDYVETNDGKVGYISHICYCDICKERGFFEPTIKYTDGSEDYISNYSAPNIKNEYKRIGKYSFEKRKWTGWFKAPERRSINPFGDGTITMNMFYRSNGKKVQVKCGGYRAESTCCETDKFNLRTGYILAKRRLIVKMLQGQVDAYAKSL